MRGVRSAVIASEATGKGEFAFTFRRLAQNGGLPPVPRTNLEFELSLRLERR